MAAWWIIKESTLFSRVLVLSAFRCLVIFRELNIYVFTAFVWWYMAGYDARFSISRMSFLIHLNELSYNHSMAIYYFAKIIKHTIVFLN